MSDGSSSSDGRGPGRAAFFDLDKTLIPGSSLFLLARGLHASGHIKFRLIDIIRFGWGQVAFRLRGETEKDLGRSQRSGLNLVAGRRQDDLRAWCVEIAREWIVPRVYGGMADVIDDHKARGDATYLVTAAPVELAQSLADELGMSGAIGTVAEVDEDGIYTGVLPGPVLHGEEKAQAVAARARELGLDLAQSSAYSDSVNDLPILELVGHPYAVNPARALKRLADERGWPVKDMRSNHKALAASVGAGAMVLGGGAVGILKLRRRRR